MERGVIPSFTSLLKQKKTMGQRLDIYDKFPSGMQQYLGCYGWHFSKRMAQFAISRMKVSCAVDEERG